MLLSLAAVMGGLVLLVMSADKFVEGAAAVARHAGMSPLLIGMVVVGFGTSAPEMVVSAISAWQGAPGLALGNAFGSNITNIALILGLTAVIAPVTVHSNVLRKELPILLGVTLFTVLLLVDGSLDRLDGVLLLAVFCALMAWSILQGIRRRGDTLDAEMEHRFEIDTPPLGRSLLRLVAGLVVLVLSSRLLVWGAVRVASSFGVSDLVIGLTVVAVGTSLPELAASLLAVKKGEHDIALGNVLGSNLFNTLAVVGIAGCIEPMRVSHYVLLRDCLVMTALTMSLFIFGFRLKGVGRINRFEGGGLLLAYVSYNIVLVFQAMENGS